MSRTKRSQNKCEKCNYTWYPRGKNLSLKCPSCGSTEVGFAGTGIGLVALIIVGVTIFGGKTDPTPQPPAKAESVSASPAAFRVAAPVPDPKLTTGDANASQSGADTRIAEIKTTPVGTEADITKEKQAICAGNSAEDCIEDACASQGHVKTVECQKRDTVENKLY